MQLVRATSTAALFLLFGTIAPAYAQHDQQNEKQGKPEKERGRQQENAPPSARQQHSQEQPQRPQARGQQRQDQPQERHGQATQQPQQRRARDAQEQQQRQSAQQPREARRQQPQLQQQPQRQRVQQNQQQRPQQEQEQRSQQARQPQQPYRTQQQAAAWQQQRGWLRQGGWQERSTWQQGRAQQWEREHRSWAQRGGYGGYYIPQARFSLYFGRQHWFRMHNRPTIYMGFPRFSYSGFSFLLVDPWPEHWAEGWYRTDDVYIDYDDGYYLYNRRYPSFRLAITVVL